MAITYRLEDQRITFYWDQETHLWTAKSDDIEGLNIQAKSFSTILKWLKKQHPEFPNSTHIFFPAMLKT